MPQAHCRINKYLLNFYTFLKFIPYLYLTALPQKYFIIRFHDNVKSDSSVCVQKSIVCRQWLGMI